jgi:hypothetical protein
MMGIFYRKVCPDLSLNDKPEGISDEQPNDKARSQSNISNW